jgi:outer membrane protein assembly factor BamA
MRIPAKIQRLTPAILLIYSFFFHPADCMAQLPYPLQIRSADQQDTFLVRELGLKTAFQSRTECMNYLSRLPGLLQTHGYVTASIDTLRVDTSAAYLVLFLGHKYRWAFLNTRTADPETVIRTGWNEKNFTGKPLDFESIKFLQQKTLDFLENNGYPFGKVYLDSLRFHADSVSAILKIDKGPFYTIDSIRVYGSVNLSNNFLQRYLDLPDGSMYNKTKILGISGKIRELPFVQEEQPASLSLLGTGAVLNLYLKPRRSSQLNALIGFLPNNNQLSSRKLLVTGEANVHLRNAFGKGESIGLNWQQLQVQSPRLSLFYQHPYLFRSPFGLDFSFDMLRKDSSFLNLNLNLGVRYALAATQSGKIFLQHFQTIVSQGGINTAQVIAFRRLPDIADMSVTALGIALENNKTDYRYNPRSGYEFRTSISAGTKKIRKNNEILELKDPGNPGFNFAVLYDTLKLKSYQVRLTGMVARFFPLGKQGTLKTAINSGIFQSEQIFRNELFQIGGYKTLRGFDEESEYVSRYIIVTAEYRYLIGPNSYFFGFADGGWAENNSTLSRYSHRYLGSGLGLALETKAGIFNLAWAVGKRDDLPFSLRQSKIHIGFVNYF